MYVRTRFERKTICIYIYICVKKKTRSYRRDLHNARTGWRPIPRTRSSCPTTATRRDVTINARDNVQELATSTSGYRSSGYRYDNDNPYDLGHRVCYRCFFFFLATRFSYCFEFFFHLS